MLLASRPDEVSCHAAVRSSGVAAVAPALVVVATLAWRRQHCRSSTPSAGREHSLVPGSLRRSLACSAPLLLPWVFSYRYDGSQNGKAGTLELWSGTRR
jgi:hypothetical protein